MEFVNDGLVTMISRHSVRDLVDLRDAIEHRRSRLTGEANKGAELDRTGVHDLVRERTTAQSDDSLDRHQE